MFNKTHKTLLGIYVLLLILIFLPFSESFGGMLLLITGLFILVTSILLANNIKLLKNSKVSKIVSVILMDVILYAIAFLVYGLGFIGTGDKGLLAVIILVVYLILLGASIIIGIILVILNKKQSIQGKPNKTLCLILITGLIILFYSAAVSGIARLTNSPGICSMHIEMKSDSFIFTKGMKNSCITSIAIDQKRPDICLNDRCIELVAINNLDLSICNKIKGSPSDCIFGYSLRLLNTEERVKQGIEPKVDPGICDVLEKKEAREDCLTRFAFELKDIDFCVYGNLYLNCYDQLANVTNNGNESQCSPLNSPAKEQCIQHVHATILKSTN